ncbi:MAG: cupin domain-containing protein [Bacteroidetes bacterium HGW-Bacteroidetes-9]|jgi:quercetin dioxygenase-like cupin family protein|nr:MAG: cupin domain-containing protein [Bacteroidetes bacterium HGW-Bacteroidetes-9]
MKITRLQEAPKVPFALDGHIVAHHDAADVVHLQLKPGEKIEKHANPFDVIFYVLEGKAMLESDSEKVLVHKDQSIIIGAGVNRGLENISVSSFKVLVIKLLKTQ